MFEQQSLSNGLVTYGVYCQFSRKNELFEVLLSLFYDGLFQADARTEVAGTILRIHAEVALAVYKVD